ncbi:hypothetical protein HUG17_0029 [Dermatophagoides farinae]|uniref:Uncharacterized protein n=1 Tax=Dermatophagoides farinae TaxID=6954 RepID=A0A9D4P582_DERFA|nr:hypothetical protein HUG17_0029 [Dermatophagoides farinae]
MDEFFEIREEERAKLISEQNQLISELNRRQQPTTVDPNHHRRQQPTTVDPNHRRRQQPTTVDPNHRRQQQQIVDPDLSHSEMVV